MFGEKRINGKKVLEEYELDGHTVSVVESSHREDAHNFIKKYDLDILTLGIGADIAEHLADYFKKKEVYIDGKRVV